MKWKRLCLLLLLANTALQAPTRAAQEKGILSIIPALSELGHGWTTNLVTYLLDPLSQPSEIDHRTDPKSSLLLSYQRSLMETNHRSGCGMVLFGRGNLVMNSGLYRVHLQRWRDRRSLHNAWVEYKMSPSRVVPTLAPVGEDCFWTQEWWRRTLVGQNLIFRRGLFHVVIEAGSDSDQGQLIRLAEVIDAKIRGKPVPPDRSDSHFGAALP